MTAQNKPSSEHLGFRLPDLPIAVRYFDAFSDSFAELSNLRETETWDFTFDGKTTGLDFENFDPAVRKLLKLYVARSLTRHSPKTVEQYYSGLLRVRTSELMKILRSTPQTVRAIWNECRAADLGYSTYLALKSLLHFLLTENIGEWSTTWQPMVTQLPLPKVDKYASIRTGSVFLSFEEEAQIVRHISEICSRAESDPGSLSDIEIEETSVLVISYEFGFRPKQIAMLPMRDVRIWNDGLGEVPSVHLTFMMIKQKSSRRVFPLIRKVKREWGCLFVELYRRQNSRGNAGASHLFGRAPSEVGALICDVTERITKTRRSARELRHTAAQRMVDAGASEDELAEFMGHTDLNTGLLYFTSSPAQAELVNQALGASEIYQRVLKIAHDRFISPKELALLKGEKQIAGVPHGIPISGIGGCTSGQPACPYNPVLSCYGCHRFMPSADPAIHRQVLGDLRGVVQVFYGASRAEPGSPALQLKDVIENVQAIISELEEQNHELES